MDVARRQLQAFDKVRDEWERVKDAEKPPYSRQQLAQMKVAKEAQARRPELEAVTPALAGVKELNALYRERLAYDQRLATYEQAARLCDLGGGVRREGHPGRGARTGAGPARPA